MSQDYESALSESWKIYATAFEIIGEEPNEAFKWVFKRAYALGKEKETITQDDVEKAAEAFATPLMGNAGLFTREQVKELLVKFARIFLGKQEKDADTVIQGWMARDENERLCLYLNEPKRESYDFSPRGYWTDRTNQYLDFPPNLFPDLAWSDEPQECEIIIKRKKK